MKRILVVLVFTIISLNTLALDLWVKGGVVQGTGSKKIEELGYNAGLELSQDFLGFVDLGAGVAYNGNLKYETTSNQRNVGYDVVPLYAFAKFNIIPIVVKSYVVTRLGKSFVVNDDTNYTNVSKADGGVYGAFGIGIEFLDSLQGEILYSITEVKNNPSGKDNVELVSLTLGYNFF